ncbi:uncharacterized protein LOC144111478 isoform X2 [Amblyomma americanum]
MPAPPNADELTKRANKELDPYISPVLPWSADEHRSLVDAVQSNLLQENVEALQSRSEALAERLLTTEDPKQHAELSEIKSQLDKEAVKSKGAPLPNCWAFIDGTARPICRPKRNQRAYFSGHKRVHCVKYQSLMCPNGIVCQLDGAYPGRRHDAGILRDSNLYGKLERLVGGRNYVIYGDPAYPLQPLLMKPYGGNFLTPQQLAFNNGMSHVRQAVEWGFGKVVAEFAFLDFKKNQKLLRQQVAEMYKAGTILSNCHTCLYGSQVSYYFALRPPSLHDYLNRHCTY